MDVIQGYFGLVEVLGRESLLDFLLRNKIVHAAIIFVVFFLLSRVLKWLMSMVIHHFTRRTKTRIDDLIIERTQRYASFLVFLLGVYLALVPLEIPETINSVVNNVILSLAVVLLGVIGTKILDSFIDVWSTEWAQKTRSTIDDALLPLFHKTSKVIFFI
ncbi:MAG: hypothetical protein Q8N77_03820, partial [Nanoarchaeota archaeon]|nr:hypothetical protein [Nanoarchaeota archaeon]